MNGKKAKRLRQLVRHLQNRGIIEVEDWVRLVEVAGSQGEKSRLHPDCGRAVYKKMKKNSV